MSNVNIIEIALSRQSNYKLMTSKKPPNLPNHIMKYQNMTYIKQKRYQCYFNKKTVLT